MTIVSTDNAEHYRWGEICDGWHLVKDPALSVIEERVPPGGAEVRHYHTNARQFFYVLAGIATLEVDDTVCTLAAGQGLEIAPGTPHRLVNDHADEVRFLVISAPPSHGDRVVMDSVT